MNTTAVHRLVVASAVYDLVITAPFATAPSARFVLEQLRTLQGTLGLSGDALPAFSPTHLFFVGLLGCVVTTWSIVRMLRPSAFLGFADGITRLMFSAWMVASLAAGASTLLVPLVVVELAWGVAQLWACRDVGRTR